MRTTQTAAPNVSFIRPEIARLLPQWRMIRDCLAGETAIKAAGTEYLPAPSDINTRQGLLRYEDYKKRAVFYNVTRKTLQGLTGQVFSKTPQIELPAGIQDLIENANGMGVTLEQHAKSTLQLVIAYSRAGLFVDYPSNDEVLSRSEMRRRKMRATIHSYGPTEIINWRVVEDGAEDKLSLVVLYESYPSADDGFEIKSSPQYRVLMLDKDGEYVQKIWREREHPSVFDEYNPGSKRDFHEAITIKPRDSNGAFFKYIPFFFIGAENNDPHPDHPAFYDIASLNVAHYRNSADYEEQAFVVGQATLGISGVDNEWIEAHQGTLAFGSRKVIAAPAGAKIELIQANESNVHEKAMEHKERQMIALGARLVEQKAVQRTAYETATEETAKMSVLAAITRNVSRAYTKALECALSFAAIGENGGKVVFELNSDFDVSKLSPEQQRQVVELWQKDALTFSEMRAVLFAAGTASIEDPEEASKEIQAEAAEFLKGQMTKILNKDAPVVGVSTGVADDA